LGIVQLGLMLSGVGDFVMMPLAIGSLPFDIAFFAAGCTASACR
jgi:hypothetical protein